MRTFFWLSAVGCLLSAMPAQAALIEYTIHGNDGSSSSLVTPRTGYVQLRRASDQVLVAEWQIPGIEPSLTPQTFSLAEADGHPDWAMFVDAAENAPGDYDWRTAFTTTGTPSGSWSVWRTEARHDSCVVSNTDCEPWVEMTQLERLDFTVEHWLLGVSHAQNLTVVGEGRLVPEPTSGLLLLIGLIHLAIRRKSRV